MAGDRLSALLAVLVGGLGGGLGGVLGGGVLYLRTARLMGVPEIGYFTPMAATRLRR